MYICTFFNYLYTIHWAFGRCFRSGVLVTTWSHTTLCDHGAQRAHYISMREKKTDAVRIPQFLRVCRNCGSLHKEISEVFNKNNSMTGMFLVLNGMIFNFIEAQVQIISDQLYIWESYMHISICLVVATIFQIRNCMLMSWDKKHENLRPFNKTFLLYTVILPSIRDSAGVVHPVAFPRNFNDEALALFANDERRHTWAAASTGYRSPA